ncbi:MAG: hydrogenase iron-sulfur subunit [Thermoplasmata archaeon]|nr:MAG: hydrogenase iron-sulfur subunit [Thermoplasmata archaeon]
MPGEKLLVFGCRMTASPVLMDGDARDRAGLPDMEYRELPCLGAMDPLMPLRELVAGADKVLAVGCFVGRCEHLSGSKRAEAAMAHVGDVLEEAGVDRSRVGMVLGSPIDPKAIYDAIKDFMTIDGGDEE